MAWKASPHTLEALGSLGTPWLLSHDVAASRKGPEQWPLPGFGHFLCVQRGDMVHRIATELETMIIELGVDARLLRLQLDELYGEVDEECALVSADYPSIATSAVLSSLDGDLPAAPRGLRLLARVPGLSSDQAEAVVDCFGEIGALQRATVADIGAVPGIDLARAASIKETLDRRTESAILDHYA